MGCVRVVVVLALIVPALLALPILGLYEMLLLAVCTVAVSIVAIAAGLIFRLRPLHASRIAIGISLAIFVGLAIVAAIFARGSSESCDGFCFSQTTIRIIILTLFPSFGVLLALTSSWLTWFVIINVRAMGHPTVLADDA